MSAEEIMISEEIPSQASHRPRLLLVSPTALWPQNMASKVRILNILESASQQFDVIFLGICDSNDMKENTKKLKAFCKRIILFNPVNRKNIFLRGYHRICSSLAYYLNGFPKEAYYAGYLNLSKDRVAIELRDKKFDVALFEYWFTAELVKNLKIKRIPCVLDMHDILWMKNKASCLMQEKRPRAYWNYLICKYRKLEEGSWYFFDGIITINTEEDKYVRAIMPQSTKIIKAGTGVDLRLWSYVWNPSYPPRVMFYGSLGSLENQSAAFRCIKNIMPVIWEKRPDVEIWIVGANPPNSLKNLARNEKRIKVTGFVEDIKSVLSSATIVICPNKGRYGFRSRIIEVMAVGVPVIASSDAVYGMELENGKGIAICDDDKSMAAEAISYINSPEKTKEQSLLAREEVEKKYSVQDTYEKINEFLMSFVNEER